MEPIHYFVSEDTCATPECSWRVARGSRFCLVCPNRLEAVAFAISLARDDLSDRKIALVHIRERDGGQRTVWTSANALPSYPAPRDDDFRPAAAF